MLILIAEDGDDARSVLKLLLENDGYEVAEATNGREAVTLAMRAAPALVLMDLSMPVMDGVEAIEHLRQHEATAHVPIIVLSAETGERRQRALSAGCDAYLLKPFDFGKLAGTIARLIDTARAT